MASTAGDDKAQLGQRANSSKSKQPLSALGRAKKWWRRRVKAVKRSRPVQSTIQGAYAHFVDFAFKTSQWTRLGFEEHEAEIAAGEPFVLCTWHEQLALAVFVPRWTRTDLAVLASNHPDSQIVTAGWAKRGIQIIEMETSGDKTSALRQAIDILQGGNSLGVAVDGPLGPRRRPRPGSVALAAAAGVKLVPCSWAVSRKIVLPTWDRFIIPLPWSRGVIGIGPGIHLHEVLSNAELKKVTVDLGRRLDALSADCEARLKDRDAWKAADIA